MAGQLPQTVRVLDEIITDYIIETSHAAEKCASYSRRAKIKVDDFKFLLRRDPKKMGRVAELLSMQSVLKDKRRLFTHEEADEVKRAKALARAEERGKKRKGGAGDEDDEDGEDDDRSTVVDGSTANGVGEKKEKRGRKKKAKKEK